MLIVLEYTAVASPSSNIVGANHLMWDKRKHSLSNSMLNLCQHRPQSYEQAHHSWETD
uniref:Uncharacterized protein n=1 Tax=Arundo donax TaxID=35708 RepID=A0A0A9DC56_ARUDO